MSATKQRVPVTTLNTTATTILPVDFVQMPNGVDLGVIRVTNTHPINTINWFLSLVPSGASMTSGNALSWNIAIGPSGFLSVAEPTFMASGDTLMASGSAVGLNMYTSYIRYS